MPADLFERDAVFFKRARVEAGSTIRADGHNLDLYGMELVRRNRICAPEGVRCACGQRAFIAMRGLLQGQTISCSFIASASSPKAVCWVGDTDVTERLLSQGWAELAEGASPTTAMSKPQPPRDAGRPASGATVRRNLAL
jgi:endonuclease YncB( thermonuclease family)